MWVLLGMFVLVITGIIAVVVYVDQTKDDDNENVKGNRVSNSLTDRLQPSSELSGSKLYIEFSSSLE